MARKIYTQEQKAKLIKRTRKLPAKEAAHKIGINIQMLYKWRREIEKTVIVEQAAVSSSVVELKAKPVKAKKVAAKTITVKVKKVIKAVDSIQSSLNTIENYLKQLAVA